LKAAEPLPEAIIKRERQDEVHDNDATDKMRLLLVRIIFFIITPLAVKYLFLRSSGELIA
jgi:hypothetical protein